MGHVIEIQSPAPFWDGRELYQTAVGLKPFLAEAATLQLARAATTGFSIDGRLMALIGFWPVAPGHEECFLAGRPAVEVAPFLVRLSRAARLTVGERAQHGVGLVTARVRIGHEPGERLARLAGFSRAGQDATVSIWERRLDGSIRVETHGVELRVGREGAAIGGAGGCGP